MTARFQFSIRSPFSPIRRFESAFLLVMTLCAVPNPSQAGAPVLWGYGVRSCTDFLAALKAEEQGQTGEIQRYEDWLSGFISGLNLSVGEDVLRGSPVRNAMRQARTACEKHPQQDFFNASMAFVRTLKGLR